MSKEELYDLAQEQNVKGRSAMNKVELIAALGPILNPTPGNSAREGHGDHGIGERSKDELVTWAHGLGVDPTEDDSDVDPIDALEELPVQEVVNLIIEALLDEELKALPEVAGNDRVRDHREDWEAAARGEMVEVDREVAAREAAERENALAASA